MVGRKFIAVVAPIQDENNVSIIEIIDRMEEVFFDDILFKESNDNQNPDEPSPSPVINSQMKYLVYLYCDEKTRAVSTCTDDALLFDVTGLTKPRIDKLMKSVTEESIKQRKEVAKSDKIADELEYHYHKCIELGMNHEEAVDNLKGLVEEKYKNKKK